MVTLVAMGIVVTVVSALGTYILFSKRRLPIQSLTSVLTTQSTQNASPPPEEIKTLTVVLLGYGGAGHDGGTLTDVIQIAEVNFEKQTVTLVSLPRDLWVELPGNRSDKINAAFGLDDVHGSVLKEMITSTTGLTPEYFVGIDFVGFQRVIGQNLGGITVDVPEALDDPWYPIKGEEQNPCGFTPEDIASISAQYSGFELEKQFPCRYERVHFEKGITQMQGGDALKYVRSRHGSSAGDFSRSQRQHAVLKGVRDKLLSLNVVDNLPRFFDTVASNVRTDVNVDVVKYLAPALKSGGQFTVKTVVISTDNVLMSSKSSGGQYILIPKAGANDWTEIKAMVEKEVQG